MCESDSRMAGRRVRAVGGSIRVTQRTSSWRRQLALHEMRCGLGECFVGCGLTHIDGEIAEEQLYERATAKCGKTQGTLHQADRLEGGALHGEAGEIHQIGDILGYALIGLADQRRP